MPAKKKTLTEAEKQAQYQAHLDRVRTRDQARNRSGRDIGPLPPVADPECRAACEYSLKLFCETYLPNTFNLAWSPDHLKVIERLEQAVINGGIFAYAMPRSSGKSSLARAAAIWAILYGHRRYVCLVGAAEPHAEGLLQAIKTELSNNERLLADFPESCHPISKLEGDSRKAPGQLLDEQPTRISWLNDRVVMPTVADSPSSGSVLTVTGLTGNLRGQSHTLTDGTVIRPSLILVDDPQTRESAMSPAQTKRRLDLIMGDVLGLAGPTEKVSCLVTCTVVTSDDLADQLLDKDRHPEFRGERMSMVYTWPESEEAKAHWSKYAELRAEGLREGDEGKAATDYYAANREVMDEGAVVAWPARHNSDEISALQHAWNLRLRDEQAFLSEYQNQPSTQQDQDLLTVKELEEKIVGVARRRVPQNCHLLTAGVDVHGKILYWSVVAWAEGFGGQVIDYGTWPDQGRRHFSMNDAQKTMARAMPGAGEEAQLYNGVSKLIEHLFDQTYHREDAMDMQISRMLIDGGWNADVVRQAIRESDHASKMMVSFGVGVTADRKPISQYKQGKGERVGQEWMVSVGKDKRPQIRPDVNYWKSQVHSRLAQPHGGKGSLGFYQAKPDHHRLYLEHLTAEYPVATEGQGRVVHVWRPKPNQDNHYLDTLVMSAVAASEQGITTVGHTSAPPPKRRQRKRRRVVATF